MTETHTPTPQPIDIVLHGKSRVLEIAYDSGERFQLPYEFLRVHSPSAEVQGHSPGQEVLQTGKRRVDITAVEPIGNYALKPLFDDGHVSGIFSWIYLYELGKNQEAMWQAYLQRLAAAGANRDVDWNPPKSSGGSCSSGSGGSCGCH